MTSAKFIFTTTLIAVLAVMIVGRTIDCRYPKVRHNDFEYERTKGGYHFKFDSADGSTREEIGVILFPDTPEEHLVVMGTYTVFDNETNIETMTLYTADRDGYKTRVSISNRLGPTALKIAVG